MEKEKAKLTTFCINKSLQLLEQRILEKTELSRVAFHRKAIEYLYESDDRQVHPRLLINKRLDPEYVVRDAKEQVYMTDTMRAQLEEVRKLPYNQCNLSTVFFHALMIYCSIQYPLIMEKES